jgi:hypothetical protein
MLFCLAFFITNRIAKKKQVVSFAQSKANANADNKHKNRKERNPPALSSLTGIFVFLAYGLFLKFYISTFFFKGLFYIINKIVDT